MRAGFDPGPFLLTRQKTTVNDLNDPMSARINQHRPVVHQMGHIELSHRLRLPAA